MLSRKTFCLALATTVLGSAFAYADDDLVEAAKKEGEVVWYTAQIINQVAQPIADAFQKKYGVKAIPIRADAAEVTLRIVNEAKVGAVQADVFDGTSGAPALKKAGLVAKWQPDAARALAPQYVDKEGYWTATNLYIIGPCVNTQLVPKGAEPKTWEDLLDPKYSGQIAISNNASTSGVAGLVGVVLHDMGDEKGLAYLRHLAQQKVAVLGASARTVTDQVLQGEYAIGLMVSNNQPVSSARQGAPVDTLPWSSSIGAVNAAGLLKGAPHPNAGKLLMEFLVSPEAQTIFAKADYLPVNSAVAPSDPRLVPATGGFKAFYLTPEEIDAKMSGWDTTFKSIFK